MITKTRVTKGFVGSKEGWGFYVYWNDREFAQLRSALYKTKKTATEKLSEFIKTGKYDTYGDAE